MPTGFPVADRPKPRALVESCGRATSLLRLPNGMTINNIYWNHLFKEFSEVRQFQVILKQDGSLQLLLKGSRFSPQREALLGGSTLRHFLRNLPGRIEWVDRIPMTPQGKLIQVVEERSTWQA